MKLWLFNIMISMTGLSEVICKNHIRSFKKFLTVESSALICDRL